MKYLIALFICFNCHFLFAQVNPSVDWSIVKSNEVEILDAEFYSQEVPMEAGWEYVFTISQDKSLSKAFVSLEDVLGTNLIEHIDTFTSIIQTQMIVKQSGTYVISYAINDKIKTDTLKVTLLLLRRKIL